MEQVILEQNIQVGSIVENRRRTTAPVTKVAAPFAVTETKVPSCAGSAKLTVGGMGVMVRFKQSSEQLAGVLKRMSVNNWLFAVALKNHQ